MDPSPPHNTDRGTPPAERKAFLRKEFRARRAAEAAALPPGISALILLRPPAPVAALVPEGAIVGLYAPHRDEAPTIGYAKWFHERGHRLALPWFADRDAPMIFREWANPFDDSLLREGPFGISQPADSAPRIDPAALFVPLIAFTAAGDRLGQGGGHYDRWLESHPQTTAIGLGWDCQLAETLPHEPHDSRLAAVVTPTRFYEGI